MDVMKVYEAAQKALNTYFWERAVSIGISTYRPRSLDGRSRTLSQAGGVRKWEESDPIGMYPQILTENKITSAKSWMSWTRRSWMKCKRPLSFAEASPEPTIGKICTRMFYAD